MSEPATAEPQLVRGLTLTDTISLVIGTVIGTGVFLKTAVMAQQAGSVGLVMFTWVAAGLLSLAGALTYAELGAMMPHAGGEYVYLRAAYGRVPAFLYGWMRTTCGSTGSIAVFGVAFATFLSALVPLSSVWAQRTLHVLGQEVIWRFGPQQVVAVAVIWLFSLINCLGVSQGGRVQTILTLCKVLGIGVIVLGALLLSDGAGMHAPAIAAPPVSGQAIGAAMLAALWAYDGWNNMPMVAGEVRDPGRNVPRALILGMVVVLLVYGLANLAYFYALPLGEVAASRSTRFPDALPVATKAAQTFAGSLGGKIVSVAFLLSTVGALNGSILSGSRVPYAMARHGLFPARLAQLTSGTRVPAYAILVQAAWASVLALSGTFDQLTNYVVFAGWIFYGLTTAGVFVLRYKQPQAARPYRTLGYPVVPALFVLVAGWLLWNSLRTNLVESACGLAIISLGVPVYLYFRRTAPTALQPDA